MFNIVLQDNKDFILTSCNTLEDAKKRLQDMKKNDIYLQKYYNWQSLPKYIILDNKGKRIEV